MRWRWVFSGGALVSILGLAGGLIGVGVDNTNKPKEIDKLKSQIQDIMYPVIPLESRVLPKTGPSLPSPGYEN